VEARTSTRLLTKAAEASHPRHGRLTIAPSRTSAHIGEEKPVVNSRRCLVFVLVLLLSHRESESLAGSSPEAAMPADQATGASRGDIGKCPLRAADLEKLTPYRWKVAQYQADRAFIPSNGTVRIDFCELIGSDEKGKMLTGVMVSIGRGANAEAFAKHWHAACADSVMAEARGKVQPIPGVPGGQQCVTASGSSSRYWLESPTQTIEIQPLTDDPSVAKIVPQLLAAAAR
jgi:hypothetical protein